MTAEPVALKVGQVVLLFDSMAQFRMFAGRMAAPKTTLRCADCHQLYPSLKSNQNTCLICDGRLEAA